MTSTNVNCRTSFTTDDKRHLLGEIHATYHSSDVSDAVSSVACVGQAETRMDWQINIAFQVATKCKAEDSQYPAVSDDPRGAEPGQQPCVLVTARINCLRKIL